MSSILRVILLIGAILTAFWILNRIRRMKVKMEDAIYWVIFAIILLVLGLWPELTYWLTRKLRMQSPANLIFLVIIFLMIEKLFTLSIIISQLEDKVSILAAELALRDHSLDLRMGFQEDFSDMPSGHEEQRRIIQEALYRMRQEDKQEQQLQQLQKEKQPEVREQI